MVPCCSCPIIELETQFTGGDSGRSLTTELSCGEESRAGWVLYGWLGGNNWKKAVLSHGPDIPIPHTVGWLKVGPCTWTETHSGQQIMPDVNVYCHSVW